MPWKRGLIFIVLVLFSRFCFSQETRTEAAAKTTASISGTVSQADNHAPLKNVQVIIARTVESDEEEATSSADRQFTAKSDEKGHFEITGLAPGAYYVQATHPGMALKGGPRQSTNLVTLEAGKSQTLNLIMSPTAVITGQVMNEEGEPMPNIEVGAMRYRYTIQGRRLFQMKNGVTDDKGQFRLYGLQAGTYLVVANPQNDFGGGGMVVATESSSSAAAAKANQTVYPSTYYPGEITPERATPITVKPGEEAQADIHLSHVPAHSVSGTVAGLPAPKSADADDDENSRDEYRFVIVVREGSPTPAGMAPIGKDSSFKIRGLPAGKYKLIAMAAAGKHGSAGSADVVIDSADVTGVVIGAEAAKTEITGTVRVEGDAKPDLSKLYVAFMPQTDPENDAELSYASSFTGGNGFGQIKKDGSFKATLPPSPKPFDVVLAARGSGLEDWFTSKVLIGGKDVLETGFKPSAGQAPIEIVLSNKGAHVEGAALDHDQKPFPNAQIIAFPTDPKLRRRMDLAQFATADQQGRFKLRGVRPGQYILFALEDSQEQPFTTEPFLKANSGKIQTVKLEAGDKQQVQLEVIRQQEK